MRTTDDKFMRMAIRLAERGVDRPSREPLAGALVVADGRVVGRGYCREGGPPAVVAAVDEAGGLARGATVYTNIEPRRDTPNESCVRRLIDSRVARIVVGARDYNDQSQPAGGGILNQLESIEVETGILEQACRALNEKYFKYSATGVPFVTVKFAQSLDGRIATSTGDSRWISAPPSLQLAHKLRREHDAILVGIGTVLADDPQLTVRLIKGRDPLRVIIDSKLRIPLASRVLAGGAAPRTLVAADVTADPNRASKIQELGAEILRLPAARNRSGIDISRLLEELGRRGVASVLVEGGKGVITSLLAARAVDRLVVVIAPKIIGQGTEAIGDLEITRLSEAITFSSVKIRRLGPDVIFDGRLK
ncbi:MAG: bifunctional diaminohydroxyphosphoribosylaminopyrimidine deaminase/5-amino-6-(5-phosphoribosylamino)uracil reductase RibD [Acidobacteriota bacterium]